MSRYSRGKLLCAVLIGIVASSNTFATPKIKNKKGKPRMDKAQLLKQECDKHLSEAKNLLAQILQVKDERTEANTLKAYNELSIALDAANSKASLFSQVHPDEKVRDTAEACEQELAKFSTDLSLNRDLYQAFATLDGSKLSGESKRVWEKTVLDFKRSGVDKDEATRGRIKELEEELVQIGQDFSRNIRDDVRFIELNSVQDLKGLPSDYIASHVPGPNGKIKITTDYPDYIPFMMYADNAKARQEIWTKYLGRGYPKNEEVLNKMLQKRYELANLLGYPSYADYVVETKMIKKAGRVGEFIEQVSKIARAGADKEYAELLFEKRKTDPKTDAILGYDRGYVEEHLKKAKYNFDSQDVRPYFQFEKVQKGLLDLTSKLFGIRYEQVKNPDLVWHPSVTVFDVYEGKNKMGRIYLDLFPRDNKYKHAAQFTLKSGIAGKQNPEGVLVCNFPDPTTTKGPALMDHDQVVTFFHEFGHLLHHILGGHQAWARFSGVATEWDFVEAPSQFFEEWAWDPTVLQSFATHVETGKPIPIDLVKRMRDANEFGKGLDTRTQMFYAALSLQYHNQDPKTFNALAKLKELQAKYSYFPYAEGTHFHLGFGHLEGYTAMYYTYMWSKVIAKDLLSPFLKNGMLDEKTAQRYRDTILKPGGSKDADELVADFLGRPYQFDAFKQWLEGSV